MEIYLHNTRTGKKELFTPLHADTHTVTMYNCGPTVYNYAHIGNLRSYVFADTIRRVMEWNGFTVKQVVNITDIGHLAGDADDGDDKMTKALRREGKPLTLAAMREVADFYFGTFKDDLVALGVELPEKFPFASDHIQEDIALVQRLAEKGFTYVISDGVYFDTAKFPGYGELGGLTAAHDEQSRIGAHPEKKNPRDFALWKFTEKITGDASPIGYESPFGRGFPGWHIECSAMAVKYLGSEFDIHTGGIDHISVHHNNEIAQSVCAGDPFARVWMHNAFLNIKSDAGEDLKMAKSGENFITLHTLQDRDISPLAYRYFLLNARYSSALDFSWESLMASDTAWKRLKKQVQALSLPEPVKTHKGAVKRSSTSGMYTEKFTRFVNDDIDTPKALALVWDLLRDDEVSDGEKSTLISQFDTVLGLQLFARITFIIPVEVQELVAEREAAREKKNWQLSDDLRIEIEKMGYSLKDGQHGTEIEKI